MSARPKRAPASPEEEREQLRQLTRQLHEAAQDARAAARELLAARGQVSDDAEIRISGIAAPLVNQAVTEINEHMQTGHAEFQKMVDAAEAAANRAIKAAEEAFRLIDGKVMAAEARLLGFEDTRQVADMLTATVRETVRDLAGEQKFIDDVTIALHRKIKFALA